MTSGRRRSTVRSTVTDEQVWDNITYFLEAVIPTAEAAGSEAGPPS